MGFLKTSLKGTGLETKSFETQANWRYSITIGFYNLGSNRREKEQVKIQERKVRNKDLNSHQNIAMQLMPSALPNKNWPNQSSTPPS